MFQVIALLFSFYVWSLLFQWCRLASVSVFHALHWLMLSFVLSSSPLLYAERDKWLLGGFCVPRTSSPVSSFTSWRHCHVRGSNPSSARTSVGISRNWAFSQMEWKLMVSVLRIKPDRLHFCKERPSLWATCLQDWNWFFPAFQELNTLLVYVSCW